MTNRLIREPKGSLICIIVAKLWLKAKFTSK
nr:MAG TPA: hypothetical protein [Caudoviricetes sp.]